MKLIFTLICLIASAVHANDIEYRYYDDILMDQFLSNKTITINGHSYSDTEFARLAGIDIQEAEYLEKLDMAFKNDMTKSLVNLALVSTFVHTFTNAPEDKRKHVLAGTLISVGATKLCQYLIEEDDSLICALTGIGASVLAGIGKELYDSTGRGNVDVMDAVYTFVPGTLISIKLNY